LLIHNGCRIFIVDGILIIGVGSDEVEIIVVEVFAIIGAIVT